MKILPIEHLARQSGVQFGTSGARGLVEAMRDEVCFAYTAAFMQAVAKDAPCVALGCDLRPSSPRIAAACLAAIHAAGAKAVFAGALPTPALAFYARTQGWPAVMVTGSHIPFDRNGIKFYRREGEIDKSDEAKILAQCVSLPERCSAPLPAVDGQALDAYRRRYLDFFAPGFLRGWRLGVYQHSSVARDFLPALLADLGAEVVTLGRSDAFVPVDTEAVGEDMQALGQTWAREHRLEAIVSTDGDADRPLLADERGHWLRGDKVGLLCARSLGARVVVTPVSSTTAIEQTGFFARVLRTRIGSPFVIAGMEAALAEGERAVVGFEANGGFLLGDAVMVAGRRLEALPTRDAVLPVLALLAMASERSVPLSGLSADLPRRFTASDRLTDVPSSQSRALLARLASDGALVKAWLGEEFGRPVALDETDGLRWRFANGEIVHLRPSGNAPELRCYAEAESEARAVWLVRWALERMRTVLVKTKLRTNR